MGKSFKDMFFVYEGLRKAFLFGLNVKPILKAIDAKSGDKILDAGCGFGFFSKYFSHCDYIGIDSDPKRIGWAIKNIGETPKRHFIAGDICRLNYPKDGFDKAVCYGLLHHLSDADAKLCLAELRRVVKGSIIFADPVYSKYHLISNLLCRMDSGSFVRQAQDYSDMCNDLFKIQSGQFFYSNNFIAKYFLMTVSRAL